MVQALKIDKNRFDSPQFGPKLLSPIRRLTQSFNFHNTDSEQEEAWFARFAELPDDLTKSLVLIAIMQHKEIIKLKESSMIKTFLLSTSDSKLQSIVNRFMQGKSLYLLRTELRGRLGLPRTRKDDTKKTSPQTLDNFDDQIRMLTMPSVEINSATFSTAAATGSPMSKLSPVNKRHNSMSAALTLISEVSDTKNKLRKGLTMMDQKKLFMKSPTLTRKVERDSDVDASSELNRSRKSRKTSSLLKKETNFRLSSIQGDLTLRLPKNQRYIKLRSPPSRANPNEEP